MTGARLLSRWVREFRGFVDKLTVMMLWKQQLPRKFRCKPEDLQETTRHTQRGIRHTRKTVWKPGICEPYNCRLSSYTGDGQCAFCFVFFFSYSWVLSAALKETIRKGIVLLDHGCPVGVLSGPPSPETLVAGLMGMGVEGWGWKLKLGLSLLGK